MTSLLLWTAVSSDVLFTRMDLRVQQAPVIDLEVKVSSSVADATRRYLISTALYYFRTSDCRPSAP